jgi:hypothetical protein
MRHLFSFANPVNEKAARVVGRWGARRGAGDARDLLGLAADPSRLRVLGTIADRTDTEPAGVGGAEPACAAARTQATRSGPSEALRAGTRRRLVDDGAGARVRGLASGGRWGADRVRGAAGLESIFGYCLGRTVFGRLMRGPGARDGVRGVRGHQPTPARDGRLIMRVDVHQHIWTDPLLAPLGARQTLPLGATATG